MSSDRVTRALAILRLAPGASSQQIRASFRREARRWHPDRHYRDSEGARDAANRFRIVREAYDLLMAEGHIDPEAGPPRRVSAGLDEGQIDEYVDALNGGYAFAGEKRRLVEVAAGVALVVLSYVHYKPFFPLVLFLPVALLALPNRAARVVGWLFVAAYAVGIPVMASRTGWPILACRPDCWFIQPR